MTAKIRKIGTMELAFTLIVLGIAIVLDRITGSDWFGRALSLWPLVLISIGGEIIWWQARARKNGEGTAWKLDGKSLIILTLVLAVSGIFNSAHSVFSGINKNFIWNLGNGNAVKPVQSVKIHDSNLSLTDAESITIDNPVGRILVHGTKGDTIHLVAEAFVNALDMPSASDRAKQIQVEVQQGKNAKIKIKDQVIMSGNQPSVNLVLEVPEKMAIISYNNAGEIEISRVANVDVSSSAGKIQVSDVTGEVKAKTNAGEIMVTNAGSAILSTDMGRITVKDVKNQVNATTHAGEITVENKITVDGDWELQTDLGKIDVAYPKSSSVHISAKTDMGTIKGDGRRSNGPNASMEYGEGKYKIHMQTNAGTIEINAL